MSELTQQDREAIQNQIELYRENELQAIEAQKSLEIPNAPNGVDIDGNLSQAINDEATPSKIEAHRIRLKIKGLWHRWRVTTLDAKSLEVEKLACQISVERAKTKAQLSEIHREEELANARHWLTLNKGNLEEIEANTTSKPNILWYGLRRGFHHITKLTTNVPKIIKNLFWVGTIIIALILLKHFNII